MGISKSASRPLSKRNPTIGRRRPISDISKRPSPIKKRGKK